MNGQTPRHPLSGAPQPGGSGPVGGTRGGPPPVGGTFTFGGRKGRMSATRLRALHELVPRYTATAPLIRDRPLVVEIGCGKGDATAAMAAAQPDLDVIACEPNDAAIANLAILVDAAALDNVRLWVGDAFHLLTRIRDEFGAGAVQEIRVWFPDPWPKPRQARKRLVTTERLAVITDALAVGGWLRLATDSPAYAGEALAAVAAEPRLAGGRVDRLAARPITAFEARGLREGREPIDIAATRIA